MQAVLKSQVYTCQVNNWRWHFFLQANSFHPLSCKLTLYSAAADVLAASPSLSGPASVCLQRSLGVEDQLFIVLPPAQWCHSHTAPGLPPASERDLADRLWGSLPSHKVTPPGPSQLGASLAGLTPTRLCPTGLPLGMPFGCLVV